LFDEFSISLHHRLVSYVKTLCSSKLNFRNVEVQTLLQSASAWLKSAEADVEGHLDDNDVIRYYLRLKSVPGVRVFVELVLEVLVFIPASAICECSFSTHAQVLRADRASMNSEVASDLVVLSRAPQTFEEFVAEEHPHLYPLLIRSGDLDKAVTKKLKLLNDHWRKLV
jgi:hypothetical protein